MVIKHKGLVTLIIAIIIITASVKGIYILAQEGTLYIEDIQGDASVLEDVVIKGLIQDKYVGKTFELRGNTSSNEHISYDHYLNKRWHNGRDTTERVALGRNIYLENIILPISFDRYRVEEDYLNWVDFQVYTNKGTYTYTSEVSAKPRLVETDEGQYHYESAVSSLNRTNPFYTLVNNEIYFTIPSSLEYAGSNGIFKIEGIDHTGNLNVSRLSTLSLDSGGIKVYGIASTNDKLVLVFSKDGILILNTYSLEGGILYSKKIVELDSRGSVSKIYSENNHIHLMFNMGSEVEIFTFLVDDKGIEKINLSTIQRELGSRNIIAFYIKDKLYIFENAAIAQSIEDKNYAIPKYKIIVTQYGELLYEGYITPYSVLNFRLKYDIRMITNEYNGSSLSLDELIIEIDK
ncbi:hypothetical protein EDC18_10976 [Natranaerovirga pectinivora]|uniref:Uncharacterized protein n=1 Tax=Natranaerovirga pectinivora TaxID=682400 RepID=A0A4R3MIG7_9FIRM|nr:hypothetical protein [Natranaerovirga pectinivora]TCT13113.1 hypothetical protein EDC18_10976 [Natranaerovirga pectinivora]